MSDKRQPAGTRGPIRPCRPAVWCVLLWAAAALCAGCAHAQPTATPSPTLTAAARPNLPSPTKTPIHTVAPASPTPTPVPTQAPARTPTPPPEWHYWPNVSDLRQIAVWDGDLWIAALSGLVRYRPAGEQWAVWTAADGLGSSTCESVVAWHGWIWSGTPAGVARYHPATDTWYVYGRAHGLLGTHNARLYVDRYTDTLWLGSLEGLAAYDPAAERWIPQTAGRLPLENVTSLAAEPRALWVSARHGSAVGIWRLDKASQTWHAPALPPGSYTLVQGQGVLALDAEGGIYRYTQEEWRTVAGLEASPTLPLVAAYDRSQLWIGTGTGWLRHDLLSGQAARLAYPAGWRPVVQGPPVWAGSRMWVPTRSGLLSFDPAQEAWQRHAPAGRPAQIERVLLAADDGLVVDTASQPGLLQPSSGSWQPLAHPAAGLEQGRPEAAHRPGNPDLWFYSPPAGVPGADLNRQIWHYADLDAVPDPIGLPPDLAAVQMLPLVDGGRLWLYAGQTLAARPVEGGDWESYSLAEPMGPWFWGAQEPGAIWMLAAQNKLIRLDTREMISQTFPIPIDAGWRLIALTPDSVWLGGDSSTLLAMDRLTGHWRTQPLDPACTGAGLAALAAQGSVLWAAGEHGVVRYRPESREQICCTTQAGMMDNQAEQIVPLQDGVWFVNSWRGLWGRTWPETRP